MTISFACWSQLAAPWSASACAAVSLPAKTRGKAFGPVSLACACASLPTQVCHPHFCAISCVQIRTGAYDRAAAMCKATLQLFGRFVVPANPASYLHVLLPAMLACPWQLPMARCASWHALMHVLVVGSGA